MKIIYYILIFLLIGAIVGLIWGFTYTPTCPIDPTTGMKTECMGDPITYGVTGLILGSVVGIIIGAIVGFIRRPKKFK